MMKTIKSFKLLILVILVCGNLFSQTSVYKPFPQIYGSWHVTGQHYIGSPPTGSYLTYQNYEALGDTVVGSYTYKKVTVSTSMYNPFNYGPKLFAFGYRNDSVNKKVYYLDVTSGINKDTLWYDFNLNVGDSLKETFAYTDFGFVINNQRRIVSSIDSVLICGTYYKQFNFGCTIGGGFETSLIEGAGFKDKFDVTGYLGDCPFEPYSVYYSAFSTCNITSIETYVRDNQIKLYPNPVSSELIISSSLYLSGYSIINNMGEIGLNGTDVANINVASLASGMYLIKMQDKSGNNYQSKFIKQ